VRQISCIRNRINVKVNKQRNAVNSALPQKIANTQPNVKRIQYQLYLYHCMNIGLSSLLRVNTSVQYRTTDEHSFYGIMTAKK
jgi:hypothetical protein